MTHQRILATVSREDFVGRNAELQRIVRQASHDWERQGLLLSAAPRVGAGELLRQSYDELFSQRAGAVPLHFAFTPTDSLIETGRNFFQASVQQYIAYRRVDPLLCKTSLTLRDLAQLALPADYEVVATLLEDFERERSVSDEREFLRFCLGAYQR